MAKYAGLVGFIAENETTPGVWEAIESVRPVQGDILRAASSYQGGDKVNEDITLQHRISLMGDSYLYERFFDLRWIEYAGGKWEITSIEVSKPRVIVTIGGVYHR